MSKFMNTREQLNRNNHTSGLSVLRLVAFPNEWPRDGETTPPAPPAPPVFDVNDPAIKKLISEAVNKETAGLKENRDKALGQYKTLQDRIDALGGDDGLAKLVELNEAVSKNEELQLLKDGKINEVYERRVKPERDKFAAELKAAQDQLSALTSDKEKALAKLNSYIFKSQVTEACKAAEVLPIAFIDVERAAKEVFVYDEELDRHVMKDAQGMTVFGLDKDKKPTPKGIVDWILTDMRKTARHWFPPSKGTGLKGDENNRGPGEINLSAIKNDPKAFAAAREKEGAGGGVPRH